MQLDRENPRGRVRTKMTTAGGKCKHRLAFSCPFSYLFYLLFIFVFSWCFGFLLFFQLLFFVFCGPPVGPVLGAVWAHVGLQKGREELKSLWTGPSRGHKELPGPRNGLIGPKRAEKRGCWASKNGNDTWENIRWTSKKWVRGRFWSSGVAGLVIDSLSS